MAFVMSRATLEDIPGMIDVWYHAFNSPHMLKVFPDSETGREWAAATFAKGMRDREQNTVYMVIKDTADANYSKGRVVAYSIWIVQPSGPVPEWNQRWLSTLPADMSEDIVGDGFFKPMARQHAASMKNRPHYFLEVLATHEDYRKQGLASRLLDWGSTAADRDGWECYLDAAPTAKALYEKHGYVEQPLRDEMARAVPMLRPAKKVGK